MRWSKALMGSPKFLTSAGLVGAAIGLAMSATPVNAGVCQDLWVQRNSIYKAYGYCFKTPDAINYFGNAGCQYDYEGDIPMSRADKQTVLAIKKREKQLGCL